jgi:predicted lipid-binding transport protein (Tim44 family)
MHPDRKTHAAVTLAFTLLAVALAAIGVLADLGNGSKAYGVGVVVLAIVVALIGAALAAVLNGIKSAPKREGGRSAHQAMGGGLVAGLLVVSLGAMVVLGVNFGPGEVQKAALGSLITLAGVGVAAVLTMLRTEANRKDAAERMDRAELEARSAREHAETARAEAAVDRDEAAARDAETRRIVADPKARRAERKAAR